MKVVLLGLDGEAQDGTHCDECGTWFEESGVMVFLDGLLLDEVTGKMTPECKLFCSHVCSDTWRRKQKPVQ